MQPAPASVANGRYRIVGELGSGAQGRVCRATDEHLRREVALKFVRYRGPAADHAKLLKVFLREVVLTAAVRGRHVPMILDYGVAEREGPFVVMELVEGEPLVKLLERGPLEAPLAGGYAAQICEGLGELHAQAVVHRDVKPANVIVARTPTGEPWVRLVDLGVAKMMGSELVETITSGDGQVGTPLFMSPEQWNDPASVDHRTDVWGVGVVLYEMLTGKVPFEAKTIPALIQQITEAPARRLEGDATAYQEVIDRSLAKDPAKRFQSAAEMSTAIRQVLAAQEQLKTTVVFGERLESERRVRRRITAVAAGAVAVACVALIVTTIALTGGTTSREVAAREVAPSAGQRVGALETVKDAAVERRTPEDARPSPEPDPIEVTDEQVDGGAPQGPPKEGRTQRAASQRRPRAQERGEGTLALGARPPCRIYLDDRDTGLFTPQRELKLPAGRHKVTLLNNEFGINESFTVEVKAGEVKKAFKDYTDMLPEPGDADSVNPQVGDP